MLSLLSASMNEDDNRFSLDECSSNVSLLSSHGKIDWNTGSDSKGSSSVKI